jgi:integrase
VEPARLSVDDLLDRWLESVAKWRVSERTYVDFRRLLANHIRPKLGPFRLDQLRPVDIQNVYTSMQAVGIIRTIRYVHVVLSQALKQAVKWGIISRNPCEDLELSKQKREEMRALSQAEAVRFLNAADDDKQGLILALALATGMRPEEYLGLQWKDIDFKRGTATVKRVLCERSNGGGWYFKEPKTRQSRRSVPLPGTIVKELIAHHRRQAELRLKQGDAYENNDLVFASEKGSPISRHNLVSRHFKPTLKRAGLSATIRLYDLRHSCATLLLAAGENPNVVAERLGHASIVLTLDTYSHVLPSIQQAATEKLERMLYGTE